MSTITLIGAGNMARGIGTRAVAAGYSVQVLDTSAADAAALAADLGNNSTSGAVGTDLTGELVVLAVPYTAALELVAQYAGQLSGRVIIDITNPVDFATFDSLVTPAGSSAAEEIAKAAPAGVAVVKAFNTTFAGTLVAGAVAGLRLDVLIAGDDEAAKGKVAALVSAGGLRPIDVGPLRRAQQLEQTGFLNMLVQGPLGTGFGSALKFVS